MSIVKGSVNTDIKAGYSVASCYYTSECISDTRYVLVLTELCC